MLSMSGTTPMAIGPPAADLNSGTLTVPEGGVDARGGIQWLHSASSGERIACGTGQPAWHLSPRSGWPCSASPRLSRSCRLGACHLAVQDPDFGFAGSLFHPS